MVEDLMYVSILDKFAGLGVDMLPRIDDFVHTESPSNLKVRVSAGITAWRHRHGPQVLMEGVHSRDAVELVKEHVLSVLGPASMAFSNTMIKMSQLQAAQVYAASLMFGYFLRRVDRRFQLDKAMGTLPELPEDAVDRLNRLLAQADSVDESDDPDSARPAEPGFSYSKPDSDGAWAALGVVGIAGIMVFPQPQSRQQSPSVATACVSTWSALTNRRFWKQHAWSALRVPLSLSTRSMLCLGTSRSCRRRCSAQWEKTRRAWTRSCSVFRARWRRAVSTA